MTADTATSGIVTRELPLDEFPSPEELWTRYCAAKGFTPEQMGLATQLYYDDGTGRTPRYYQVIAITRTVDAIGRGVTRILLVMATGTGKTYTAFQIIWRLWKSGAKKRILFLVDRNILADQTKTNDFKPFGKAMPPWSSRQGGSFRVWEAPPRLPDDHGGRDPTTRPARARCDCHPPLRVAAVVPGESEVQRFNPRQIRRPISRARQIPHIGEFGAFRSLPPFEPTGGRSGGGTGERDRQPRCASRSSSSCPRWPARWEPGADGRREGDRLKSLAVRTDWRTV